MSERPEWAEGIRRKYLRGESSLFFLHHNIFDQLPHEGRLYDLTDYLTEVLLGTNKQTIVVYDPSSRVRVVKRGVDAVGVERAIGKRAPSEVLPALEELLLTSHSTALVIEYADMLAPAGEMNFLTEQDRVNVVTLHRWSLDPRLTKRDNVIFIIAEQAASVHPMLISNSGVASVQVPLPDQATRATVCRLADASLDARQADELAAHAAGLKAVHLFNLLTPEPASPPDDTQRESFIRSLLGESPDAAQRARKFAALTRGMGESAVRHLINPDHVAEPTERHDGLAEVLNLVRQRKREIIETECFGLIEFMEAKHDFSAVGGMEPIKAELRKIAAAIRAGDRARVPMGILLVGPMGTGKTFLAGAFARESGIAAVKLKNFRSKWVGATEANLEKVLTIVRALGPILLVIDEGDRSFGGGDDGDNDGGTSSRVIARIKEFMSDPENRGRVVFVLMTNRPDKLDTDIKRAGRLDRKIPLFYAGTPEEIEGILLAQLARHDIRHGLSFPRDREAISAPLVDTSNADLEAVVLRANEFAHEAGSEVTPALFEQAVRDHLPSRDEAMLRYMELLAVFEASSRAMLPPKYRDLSNEELDRALRAARLAIGR